MEEAYLPGGALPARLVDEAHAFGFHFFQARVHVVHLEGDVVAALQPRTDSLAACPGRHGRPAEGRVADTSFAAMQARGRMVMGVDQYTSTHVFEDLPDGGRIVLERNDPADSAGIAAIRAHMRSIAAEFHAGDFSKPFQVHAEVAPGTDVMTARASAIDYQVVDRPRGAEVRIVTHDPETLAAIHEFLAFQRGAHHAAGHEHMH